MIARIRGFTLSSGALASKCKVPVKTGASPQRTHLIACAIALAVITVGVVFGVRFCDRTEQRYVHALAPDLSEVKLNGVVLQKKAFAQTDLLVLYGSSELAKSMPNNAAQFFQDYPTGFRVFPVGQPGTTCLAVLEKVAAVGGDIRGKKVAFSMSPGWFFTEVFDPKWYEGNFSHLQAYELAFSEKLSPRLKRDIARRMLAYPKTLENQWLLEFTLKRLAGDTAIDYLLYAAIWPMGRMQNLIGRLQDHFEATMHIVDEETKLQDPEHHGMHALNWSTLVKRAAQYAVNQTALRDKRLEVQKKRQKYASAHVTTASQTQNYMHMVEHAKEWTDLELLLRVFHELGAEPLLLSMPVEDIRLQVYGVSPEVRTEYLRRLDATAAQYNVALLDFKDHEKDPAFLVDFLDHLSPQGWLYYNKALDDFYHARED
jgi:D-alanine transfer protein